MYIYQGKTALITGASSGIGAAFANLLAAQGMNLILVARSEDKLITLAKKLTEKHNVRAEVITSDLSREGAALHIFEEVQRRELAVDLLVNNAGFTTYGDFDSISAERDHAQVMVNVSALVDLTHLYLTPMLARNEGAIINVASVVAFMSSPYQSIYFASKAFVLSFTRGLAAAYRGRGIRVVALCPGTTATNFFAAGDAEGMLSAAGRARTAEQAANTALRALEQNKVVVVDGFSNILLVRFLQLMPSLLVARLVGRVTRPPVDKQQSLTPAQ